MGDIEESIFQRNVPGKYSKWDTNDKERHPNDYECVNRDTIQDNSGGDSSNFTTNEIPDSVRLSILADRNQKPLTGVKGVLADYNADKKLKQAQLEADALFRKQVLNRIAEGAKDSTHYILSNADEDIITFAASIESDNDEEDDHDNFIKEFHAKRLKEMKALNASSSSSAAPSYGYVQEVSGETFLKEIDEAKKEVFVIVHLYEPSIQSCLRLNDMLDEIAYQVTNIKFMKMQASLNSIKVDTIAMPILTIYRAGEMVDTIAGIVSDFGPQFTKSDIKWLIETSMQQNGLLS